MTRRTRFVAGLCAHLAFTFSLAESVWGSTCAMPMAGGVASAHETASEIPVGSRCATHYGQEADHDGRDDRPCPFTSDAGAQVCAGVVSIPAGDAVLPALAPEASAWPFTLGVRTDLLLTVSLFRPPRA